MKNESSNMGCGGLDHLSRRAVLRLAGLSGLSWLTPLGTALARQHERDPGVQAKSLIMLWMEGAPSQLETFDPHPGKEIAYGSAARATRAKGIEIGSGFERLAEQMNHVSLLRAMTSDEGDHERAIYNLKTGYRPDPTVVHPSIGSVICHHFAATDDSLMDIPRHISIMPGGFPARGGYLGDQYDAFKVFDPQLPVPDLKANLEEGRLKNRLNYLNEINERFQRGRQHPSAAHHQFGLSNLDAALRMMSSEQVKAFDIGDVPVQDRLKFGDTPFGRGCLAAIRLIEAGVRCVEVTLTGWDTHVDNHELQGKQIEILDPAFAALVEELNSRDLLESTLVVCGGEFGRTPWLNPLGGRDHWPHGFSMAVAGGGLGGGQTIGETNPDPVRDANDKRANLHDSHSIGDLHATIYHALGIAYDEELVTPIGRPLKICEGAPISRLFEN